MLAHCLEKWVGGKLDNPPGRRRGEAGHLDGNPSTTKNQDVAIKVERPSNSQGKLRTELREKWARLNQMGRQEEADLVAE